MKKTFITLSIGFWVLINTPLFSSIYNQLILGKWQMKNSRGAVTTMLFMRNGSMGLIIKYPNGKTHSVFREYTIVGDRLYVRPVNAVNAYTFIIQKLTKKRLIIKNEVGKVYAYDKVLRR